MLVNFEALLTEEELAVLKRGRRARARRANRPSTMSEYRKSTGFEALLGYLDLSCRKERLEELMASAYELERENE
jgi:ribonuclease-3 family protein